MIGIFLGAGFSKWAADLPLVSQLFDFRISPFGPQERAKLDLVTKLKSTWDEENLDATPEQFIADTLSYPIKYRKTVLWYIVRRLSESFIWTEYHSQRQRRHVLMIDEYRKYQVAGVNRTKSFFDRFGNNASGIVTTNYDLLIEYALGTKGFNYGVQHQTLSGRGAYPVSQWNNPIALTGAIPLAKIHGSISWDENSYYTDGRRGLTGNALIVAPTPEKRPPNSLEFHWSLSGKIMTKSTRLVVFGFAFNPYDEAVLNHIKDNGQNIKSVILIDIAPNLGAAKDLWPKAEISSTLPPPEGDQEINQWIQAEHLQ